MKYEVFDKRPNKKAVNLTAFLLTLFVILFGILEFIIKLYFKFNRI